MDFPSLALSLAPGEEREVGLPLSGYGLLRLRVASRAGVEVHLVRALPEGGRPLPYTLLLRAEGAHGSLEGTRGGLSLEGALSREVGVGLLLEGNPLPSSLRLALGVAPYALRLSLPSPGLSLGYREGPWEAALEYPWALEGRYSGKEAYRLRLSPEALAVGYADGTWALSGTLPFARPEGLALRLERYGTPHLHARWEGGAYLGFSLPPFSGEVGYGPQGPSLRLAYGGGGVSLQGGYAGGPFLALGVGYEAAPFRLSARVGLPGPAYGLSLGYREGPWTLGGELAPWGFLGWVRWEEGPYALRLEGRGGANPGLALSGSYAFRLPVPEEVTLALGGYEEVPVEGRVEVEGRPVKGARVRAGARAVETDAEGRFRLYLPRAGGTLRAEPPGNLLALPAEASWRPGEPAPVLALPRLRPPPPVRGRGPGAYLVGKVGAFVPCGGEAVLPPGAYRLLPQGLPGYRGEEGEVRLEALAREEVVLSFVPVPTEALPEARPLRVEWPAVVAPGEVARVRVLGAEEAEFSLPLLRKEASEGGLLLYFQVPWEAEGALPLEVRAGGRRERRLVPVDKARPLLVLRLSPPRARLGEEVEARLEALFPAEGAALWVGGREVPLVPEGTAFVGRFTVEEAFYRQATPLASLLALPVVAEAWQGERRVRVGGGCS